MTTLIDIVEMESELNKDQLFGNITKWNTCNGHGTMPKEFCKTCNGSGLIKTQAIEKIGIPALAEHEEYLKLEKLGHHSEYLDGEPGNLIVKVVTDEDDNFTRDGLDLHSNISLTISDAILGTIIEIKTLEGDTELIRVESGTTDGHEIKIKGKGIYSDKTHTYGDLYLKVHLKMPDKITKEIEDIVKKCFE